MRRTRREKGVPVARGASGDGLPRAALGGQHLVIVSTCAEDCTERNGSEPHAPTRVVLEKVLTGTATDGQ